jgi:hypothetical protein
MTIRQPFHIVEFKYCRDTDPTRQLAHCSQQHATLIGLLLRNGYKEDNIKLIPILLGVSGTVYQEHTLKNIQKLGVSKYHAMKCAKKMHIHAIKLLHSIVAVRRRLENAHGPSPPNRPLCHTNRHVLRYKPP